MRVGRVLCKTIHLQTSSIQTDESSGAAAAGQEGGDKKQKGPGLTVLSRGWPDGVTDEQARGMCVRMCVCVVREVGGGCVCVCVWAVVAIVRVVIV